MSQTDLLLTFGKHCGYIPIGNHISSYKNSISFLRNRHINLFFHTYCFVLSYLNVIASALHLLKQKIVKFARMPQFIFVELGTVNLKQDLTLETFIQLGQFTFFRDFFNFLGPLIFTSTKYFSKYILELKIFGIFLFSNIF